MRCDSRAKHSIAKALMWLGIPAVIVLLGGMWYVVSAKRTSAMSSCIGNLSMIESAKDGYMLIHGTSNGVQLTWDDLCPYIKDLSNKFFCVSAPHGERGLSNYSINPIGVHAVCNVVGANGGHWY